MSAYCACLFCSGAGADSGAEGRRTGSIGAGPAAAATWVVDPDRGGVAAQWERPWTKNLCPQTPQAPADRVQVIHPLADSVMTWRKTCWCPVLTELHVF